MGRIVTPDDIVSGRLVIDRDRIRSIESAPVPDDAPWLLPGFVDMHVHGGGGYTFTTGDADAARSAAAFHAEHGTTTLLASLVSSPHDVMLAATRAYAPLVDEDVLGGIHFEGPYLSGDWCGAQNPAFLRGPSTAELVPLLDAADGAIRMITIAPELPGAHDAIRYLVESDVVVAVGHTGATYRQVMDAISYGASVGTHVFNGMRPPHHRAPGPVYALLGSPTVTCEFVADGAHLADETLEFALTVVGSDRAALVTDAIAAAGMEDGTYELGGQAVIVTDGVARLAATPAKDGAAGPGATGPTERRAAGAAEPGAIAGSTLTMDAAFRRALRITGSMVAAATAAATTPARALGLTDRGSLEAGLRADIVTLTPDLVIAAVHRAGRAIPLPL